MINNDSARNNHHRLFIGLALVLVFGLTVAGCRQEAAPPAVNQCSVKVDDTAYRVFSDLCRREAAGQGVGRSNFQVFADLPIISHWKESMSGNLPSVRIVNWLEEAFKQNPDHSSKAKRTLDRRQFSASYRYSRQHLAEIDTLIDQFRSKAIGCRLMRNARFWLSPEQMPDSLTVVFLPSKPEIRITEDYLFVDTGVLQAGNMEQLVHQLTGLLFRARMSLPGGSPSGMQGSAAVAHSIRVMMNEGLIGYIEDQPGTVFSPDHPKLGKLNIVPENVFDHGRRAITLLDENLPKMLADPKLMQKHGQDLAKTFVAASSLNQGGYCLSYTIAQRLGEDRLRQVVGSPAAWLAAYQEAALLNPVPAPEPYKVMDKMYLSMPPLQDDTFTGLEKLLQEFFPTAQQP